MRVVLLRDIGEKSNDDYSYERSYRGNIINDGTRMLVVFRYTFGENLEILAYLYWPGLILDGDGILCFTN